MAQHPAAGRYARALFEAASDPDDRGVSAVARDLETVLALFAQPQVARVFRHRLVPPAKKQALIDEVLRGRVHPLVQNLIRLLVDKGREDILSDIAAAYKRLVEAAHGVAGVEIRTAADLGADGYSALQRKLSAILGHPVRLHPRVDPELLGGVILKIGDTLYDASVKRRLERLHRLLAGTNGQGARGVPTGSGTPGAAGSGRCPGPGSGGVGAVEGG